MYLRTIKRKNKDGSVVEYVQLAHNVRHPEKGYPKAEVIHSFGRKDRLDVDGLKRLMASIDRFIEYDDSDPGPVERPGPAPMAFVRSTPVGGVFLLHTLWRQLQIGDCLQEAAAPHPLPAYLEPVLFAMVAGGALDSYSTGLPALRIIFERLFPGQDPSLDARRASETLETLRGRADAFQKAVSRSVARWMDPGLDLVFVHVVPVCGILDAAEPSNPGSRRAIGADHESPPEGLIGIAASRTGVPLRYWLHPAALIDRDFVGSIQTDLSSWTQGRIVWVMDKQGVAEANRAVLRRTGCTYILGETLRGSRAAEARQKPKGRFKILGPELQIKVPVAGEGACRGPCVIAFHPRQAAIDRNARERLLRRLRSELENRRPDENPSAASSTRFDHVDHRYIKILKSGRPKIDITRVRQEERNDGKYLLLASDERLSPETVAWGHKTLLDSVRACRRLKPPRVVLSRWGFPPEDHADAGMLASWLALLLTRNAEVQSAMAWPRLCREMQGLHLGEFRDGNRRVFQYTEPTDLQKKIQRRLGIALPQTDLMIDAAIP